MCSWFAGREIVGQRIICMASGWPVLLAFVCAAIIGLIVLIWAVLGARGTVPRIGAACVLISALFLSIAAGLPALQPDGNRPPGGRVIVLLDGSESVRRTGGQDLQNARSAVADHLRTMAGSTPPEAAWRGAVWSFGIAPRVIAPDATLTDLAPSVIGADLGPLSSDSDLEAAVSAALQDISQGPGAGMIMLVTDGLETRGDVAKAAQTAQLAGIAIHVFGVGSDAPAQGLLSYDIGPDQTMGRPAVLRATVQGKGTLDWGVNGAAEPAQSFASAAPQAVRLPVTFGERGLNFIDLRFAIPGQAAQPEFAYTLVRGPARVLVYGNAPWVDNADPARFLIERASPSDQVILGNYDAIVIDALSPDDFAADMPLKLLETASGGVGVFLVNGPLRGSREDMQRLSDWEETALGAVLPVNSDPAAYIADPPKRDVMIIIDTSGSMGGSNISIAREAANVIIGSVRPQDSLVIVPFSSDAGRAFEAAQASPANIARARNFVAQLQVAGGTNMTAAIDRARQLRGNNCALFIIGDGGYEAGQITGSPICYTTAIGVAGGRLPGIDTSWGQQIPINSARQLGQISFTVFEPEPRTKFWEDGPLQALTDEMLSPFAMTQSINGVALSYPRPESTDLSVMSAPPRAPVLAFRQDPELRSLRTGVFLGTVPGGLAAGPDSWASAVLSKITGWDDPDLFDIDFDLNGEIVDLHLTPQGSGSMPTNIAAAILLPDGTNAGIALAGPDEFGSFAGKGRISLSNTTMRGILDLEMGAGDVQSIPLRLPSRSDAGQGVGAASQETFGFGINQVLLNDIQSATGGVDLTRASPAFRNASTDLRKTPIWPWLAGLASVLFAGSLFFGGARR